MDELELKEAFEKVTELLERIVEQNEEIVEKLINISTPGRDYGEFGD